MIITCNIIRFLGVGSLCVPPQLHEEDCAEEDLEGVERQILVCVYIYIYIYHCVCINMFSLYYRLSDDFCTLRVCMFCPMTYARSC